MKTLFQKIKTLDLGVIARSIMLILAYVNQMIAVIGMQSFATSMTYQVLSLILTLAASTLAAWKNNDFTHLAQLAGKVLKALKDKKLDEKEIQDLLDKASENLDQN